MALVPYPLILGHLSFTIQTFVDRLFLSWYSAEAVAAAVTGRCLQMRDIDSQKEM